MIGETLESPAAVSGGPGGAWVAEHPRSMLAAPPQRYVGEVLTA